jgi:hypothetical protein
LKELELVDSQYVCSATDQTVQNVSVGYCSHFLNIRSSRASLDHIPALPNLADFSWNETTPNLCIATIPRHYLTAFPNSSTTINHPPVHSQPQPPPVQQQSTSPPAQQQHPQEQQPQQPQLPTLLTSSLHHNIGNNITTTTTITATNVSSTPCPAALPSTWCTARATEPHSIAQALV